MKLLSLVMLLAAAAGCATRGELRAQAAVDLKCDEAALSTKGVWPYVERVSGCGKENVYLWEHSAKKWVSPLDRAAFELSCSKEAMQTIYLSDRSIGVEGCGRKAVYQLVVGAYQPPAWVLNSTQNGQ
jgi:hypothetical protein